jgi:transmembrane sensor
MAWRVTIARQIDRDAASWVERLSAPTPDMARAFDSWIAADPAHAESFGRMQALWGSEAFVQALGEVAWQRPRPHPIREKLQILAILVRRPLVLGGGVLACASLAAALLLHSITTQVFSIAPGPARRIALADGTQVVLSGGGRLEVRMTPWSRGAELAQGEAFFDVAHEGFRRFSVASGETRIEVLGTAFDVDRQDSKAVTVRVYRGLVGIESSDGSSWRAPAGTAIRITGNRGQQLAAPFGNTPEWPAGWYETEGMSMRALIDQTNRFSPRPIRLADAELGTLPVSGRFRIAEPRMVLDALAATHELHWREDAQGYVLGRPAKVVTDK